MPSLITFLRTFFVININFSLIQLLAFLYALSEHSGVSGLFWQKDASPGGIYRKTILLNMVGNIAALLFCYAGLCCTWIGCLTPAGEDKKKKTLRIRKCTEKGDYFLNLLKQLDIVETGTACKVEDSCTPLQHMYSDLIEWPDLEFNETQYPVDPCNQIIIETPRALITTRKTMKCLPLQYALIALVFMCSTVPAFTIVLTICVLKYRLEHSRQWSHQVPTVGAYWWAAVMQCIIVEISTVTIFLKLGLESAGAFKSVRVQTSQRKTWQFGIGGLGRNQSDNGISCNIEVDEKGVVACVRAWLDVKNRSGSRCQSRAASPDLSNSNANSPPFASSPKAYPVLCAEDVWLV